MKYPLLSVVLKEQDFNLVNELADAQRVGTSILLKDYFFEDLFEPYYIELWQEAFDDYMETQTCGILSERVENVFLSLRASKQFSERSKSFQKLFIGWMQQQLENEDVLQFSGERVEDNPNHWIYHFGEIRVLALIEDKRVVILHFDDGNRVEILEKLLKEEEKASS